MRQLYPQRALLEGAETEIFKLLSYGATPEQWAEWLRAPLEHAAARGNFDLVDRLLKAGANGSAGWRGCRGRTLLDAAALGGNGDVVSALLRAGCGPDVNAVSVSSRRSALHLSAVCGHEAAARQLILAGADVNHEDAAGKCPLLIAAAGRHKDLVGDLLIGGACPNARDVDGFTPLHHAAIRGHDKVVSTLLDNASTDKDALDNGRESSPLTLASEKGHLFTVKALLVAGADLSIRSSSAGSRLSALDWASARGHVDVIQAILEHGADVNAANRNGRTALHFAAQYDRAGAVDVLLDAGAGVGVKYRGGRAPLHTAASRCSTRAMLALLRRGADVNAADKHGCTPLHWACRRQMMGVEAAVDLLLRWGASETAIDDNGKMPIEIPVLGISVNRRPCLADETERVRVLLVRAPADRVWRRRCWLVMLRARAEREGIAHSSDSSSSSGETGHGGRRVVGDGEGGRSNKVGRTDAGGGGRARDGAQGAAGVAGIGTATEEGRLSGLVAVLVEMESDGVFRTIVGYL